MADGKPVKDADLKICFVLLDRAEEKKHIKKFLDGAGIVSQFVLRNNMERSLGKMGVFTNLMRQVNAKMPLDLYRITLPDKIKSLNTMFIGIDVCHKGRTSIVGLAASTTPNAT